MGWAHNYIIKLKAGNTISFKPRGNSMSGIIDSGDTVTIIPLHPDKEVSEGDILLCKVKGKEYLHIVKVSKNNKQYQIGNAKGHINGWIHRNAIYGIVIGIRGKEK